ncbi:MAG: 2-iminoacetate synthase [Syntrophaceae bacterium PtaU1.Bin231]|nr:MAG: 2-iminoacetate synthase [Syntrophaceae bacterium PtaU1.Bin231]
MSFADILSLYRKADLDRRFAAVPSGEVERAVAADRRGPEELLALLSPAAGPFLEPMAQRAHEATLRFFGRTIQIYAPIYVSDFCENSCIYCGFNAQNRIRRRRLSLEEVDREAACLSASGVRHILLLTGESRKMSPAGYLRDCISVLKGYFSAVAIEVYPLSESEYADLVSAGADGLTIYQETYDEARYEAVHPAGPKRDFRFRLDAPERGARGGMRQVSIGALLGLSDFWRTEAFLTGLHARYLQDRYPDVEIGVSLPRLRPHAGSCATASAVTDRNMVQILLALRLFLPRLGIFVSTRESPRFRENLVPLGITRMSAGSSTRVGGYTMPVDPGMAPQFEIADHRSVAEIVAVIREKGYDPVMKDWTMLA